MTGHDLFDTLKARDIRTERRIFWRELAIIALAALLVTTYLVALWIRLGSLPMPRWLG